ncbi:TraB/GumN family protein [Pseudidiomarina sp.]|uniref:TraB/GumN family protein n=1 Tax=Pseudidiomarina sp. TaxID=2081707 RepID=UPI00299D4D8D|nr:TraB/GumN family protein [Pseudidiomarina sp.]MDX1705006.1 TraB/GumN family protein [Pseudidiomarina sp.]
MRVKNLAVPFFGVLLFFVSLGAHASLLYQISGKGIEQPSYLLGTMHVLCERDFKIDERVLGALDNTNQLVLELDLADMVVAQQLQSSVRQPGGPYLKKHLTDTQFNEVDQALQQITGVSLSYFEELRPFVISNMVVTHYLNCRQLASYEGFLLQQAKRTGKDVIGLESVADQIGIFDQIPLSEQSTWLWQMIAESEQSNEELQQMKELFLKEDVEQLYQLIVTQQEFTNYSSILLDERNRNWVEILPPLMAEQPSFIAVGAGHLGGPQGVIALLRAAGYTVQPVTDSGAAD